MSGNGGGDAPRRIAIESGYSPHWSATNRNKRSISVDLKHPEGKALILELARTADIVASNFRPGAMDKLGLGWDDLPVINPRIIVAYASGYGQTGPYALRRGQDLAAQAIAGLMALTGAADGPPTPSGTFMIDYLASMQFAQGMMLALAARERTGRGQVVDSCLLNAAVASHLQEGTTYHTVGQQYPRPTAGIAHAHNTALYGTYECADGRWLALIGEFYIPRPWQQVATALGLPKSLVEDERFQDNACLLAHTEETTRIIREATLRFTRDELMTRYEAEDVLIAPVNDHDQVFEDEQVLHDEMVLDLTIPTGEAVKVVGIPVKLSDTPGRVRRVPPMLGQHNDEVLGEFGLSAERIAELKAAGALGTEADRHAAGGAPTW